MERDFLGMNGKDLSEDSRRHDSGGSALQWPFSNNVTALQQLVAFNAMKEKPNHVVFDHHSSSSFQPLTNMQQNTQKCFDLDRRSATQFSKHAYQPQSNDFFDVASHHVAPNQLVPLATNNSFFKAYGSSSNSTAPMISGPGNITPWNVPKPPVSTAQLTIFYNGSVNVYDDVSLEKAQAIMLLASKGCQMKSNAENQRPLAHVPASTPKVASTGYDITSHISSHPKIQNVVSSPMSVSSHVGAHSRGSSSNTCNIAAMKSAGKVPTSMGRPEVITQVAANSIPMIPRAVPQARKASLARFLEKRKERVTSTMPYSIGQKSAENSNLDAANTAGKCSSANISGLSNQESWSFSQDRNINNFGESPSTKLEM